jgi:hypothetical protein
MFQAALLRGRSGRRSPTSPVPFDNAAAKLAGYRQLVGANPWVVGGNGAFVHVPPTPSRYRTLTARAGSAMSAAGPRSGRSTGGLLIPVHLLCNPVPGIQLLLSLCCQPTGSPVVSDQVLVLEPIAIRANFVPWIKLCTKPLSSCPSRKCLALPHVILGYCFAASLRFLRG